MTLTGPQWLALALMVKYDALRRIGGGLWVPNPEDWFEGLCTVQDDDWIQIATLKALERRGLARAADWRRYVITDEGRAALVEYGEGVST